VTDADKIALLDELIATLAAALDAAVRAEKATADGATHEEAKPENDKDTRALEQSYLARGQSMRTEELRTGLAETRAVREKPPAAGGRVALGSLVEADEDGRTLRLLLAPAGGGTKLSGGVQVVTPSSPLGRALVGKTEGDLAEVAIAKGERELEIVRVR
jgi:transcription elongation GreA/GreB family factor